jgi:hypothetical protein
MSREQREQRLRRVQRLFARLGDETPPPSDDDLRAMARTASSESRPLPRPIRRRRWPLQPRWTGVLGLALVVAIGVGVGIGALIAPSGTAAPAPIGTGFLPGPGWTVLQTGADATSEQQALAVATNVPLHPEDDERGIRGSSGLPYSTLLRLPATGVVIVALFTRRESEPWNDEYFPKRDLPLSVHDAMGSISYGTQVRPERPLGQYEQRVTVGGHHVVLHFYFGSEHPSAELIAAAQRQLDRLVVASVSAVDEDAARQPRATDASPAATVVDRTLSCSTLAIGGLRKIEVRAHAGVRASGSSWNKLPFAVVLTPTMGGFATALDPSSLLWISAARPTGATTLGHEHWTISPLAHGTLALSQKLCKNAEASIPLGSAGLRGGRVSPLGDGFECATPRRVLVRVRAVVGSRTRLRSRSGYLRTTAPIVEAALVVRAQSGKPLVYAATAASGKTRLFTADGCVPD